VLFERGALVLAKRCTVIDEVFPTPLTEAQKLELGRNGAAGAA
jgi:hypothetical protein